jgi:hypothetical protein
MPTFEELARMSESALEDFLNTGEHGTRERQFALEELQRRRLGSIAKPHWTLTPMFWIALVGAVFAGIAAWPVIRGFF